ncbi:hypothetical protein FVE85_2880 [Porphyridium purpureum]|uniref:F-box domain-containing protein n=1 Tax=Porphyridium purpureum TaxID=35688 RepID=A0A5J4YT40_PORPP|nr:hypothetical protein FVE85_2880 [Porphyridium purpureum]|eukprot:POR1853..scf227_4
MKETKVAGRMAAKRGSGEHLFDLLPDDVRWRIFVQLRGVDLVQLMLVSRSIKAITDGDPLLWRQLVIERWNVLPRSQRERERAFWRERNSAAGKHGTVVARLKESDGKHVPVNLNADTLNHQVRDWKTIYSSWHASIRMPSSPLSGQRHAVFGKSFSRSVAMWLTVHPSEDCRLQRMGICMRVVVQNVSCRQICLLHRDLLLQCREHGIIKCDSDVALLSVRPVLVHRNTSPRSHAAYGVDESTCFLNVHEFCVLEVRTHLPGRDYTFEPDLLELIQSVVIPYREATEAGVESHALVAHMEDRRIFDHYQLLPGAIMGHHASCEKYLLRHGNARKLRIH